MKGFVFIEVEDVAVSLERIASSVVFECSEPEMLEALANEHDAIVRDSGDEMERNVSRLNAEKLRELADWMRSP